MIKNPIERQEIRDKKIKKFDQNENGLRDHGIFGLPFSEQESELVLVPIPWEATVSHKAGASDGPKAILDASQQIDLYDPINPDAWKVGIAMQDISADFTFRGKAVRALTEKYLEQYYEGKVDEELRQRINSECEIFKDDVKNVTHNLIAEGKFVGLVGGDHSVSLGYLETLAEKYPEFGILQLDAHSNLRDAYEGLTHSHASVFFNALKIKNVSKLVQVGIRDFSISEKEVVDAEQGRVVVYSDYDINKKLFEGSTWAKVCDSIVSDLPHHVHISFDIDGLAAHLSPNTGTPVAGGFSIDQVVYLFEKVLSSGRKIIGFDLCEVAPGPDSQWDGNVGARVLYKLCLLALKSKNK